MNRHRGQDKQAVDPDQYECEQRADYALEPQSEEDP